jgi:hypothetical protein
LPGRLFFRLKLWPALWTFADVPDVEPTNNAAEPGLRAAVIYRKLSLGSRSQGGERTIERLLSVDQTADCNAGGSSATSRTRSPPKPAATLSRAHLTDSTARSRAARIPQLRSSVSFGDSYRQRVETTRPRRSSVKFMLFTYRDPSVQLNPEQRASVPAAVAAWCDEMDARGVRLVDTSSARSRTRGPFAFEEAS